MITARGLAQGIISSDRRALARGITLLESTLPEHRRQADELLGLLLQAPRHALRLGISGAPGVGKSTFIESFGLKLIAQGQKLAILAIDPSSPISGGSILGDRTRMEKLSAHDQVFIRPSPAGTTLGGVARHTREAIIACEAYGCDTVIIETVGVGQSEYVAASMVDCFVMLHMPNSGDDLQGIKRGILELADIVCVTKADGSSLPAARLAKVQLEQALMLARNKHDEPPSVILTSAISGSGMVEAVEAVSKFKEREKLTGRFDNRRRQQDKNWLMSEVLAQFSEMLSSQPPLQKLLQSYQQQVTTGQKTGVAAAREFLASICGRDIAS